MLIRFPDAVNKRNAIAHLTGRFRFKSWASGQMLVPETALPDLALESILFTVEGPAKYEQHVPKVRDSAATAV